MAIANKELRQLKRFRSRDAVKLIAKEKKISERMVRYILDGTNKDNYGVIEMAAVLVKAEREKEQEMKAKIKSILSSNSDMS